MNPSISIVILASIILFLFAIFMIGFLFFHNRKMLQNKDEIQRLEIEKAKKILIDSIQIQEEERARIGADIHDDLGPTMSALKLRINNLNINKTPNERDITQLKLMIDETIKSVRGLSHSLYPNTLEKYGLVSAINELGKRLSSDSLIVNTSIDEGVEDLDFYKQINLYRIIQEFCNNSIKYSGADNIEIRIEESKAGIEVSVSDNGSGFDTSKNENHGLGIKNMKMRSEAIGYNFKLSSEAEKGTKITLSSF